MIQRVMEDPVIPIRWGAKQKGMVNGQDLNSTIRDWCEILWLQARNDAVQSAQALVGHGLHKTIPNRLLEPWTWITVIVSATEWGNFFTLRTAPDAEDHMRHLAVMMKEAYDGHEPALLGPGEWHIPMATRWEGGSTFNDLRLSTARCGRVSYLTHDGTRDVTKDYTLHDDLLRDRHLSPFEHAAQADHFPIRYNNFVGWRQYRWFIEQGITL